MIKITTESKQDIQKFRDKYGDELTNAFLARRKQLKPPYNDIYFWMKDNPLNCDDSDIDFYEEYYDSADAGELDSFLKGPESLSNTKQRDLAKSKSKLVYKDDVWTVILPESYEAALYYGKNTKWCISGNHEDLSVISGEGWFDNYEDYLIFIDRKNNKKYCFARCWNDGGDLILWDETDVPVYEDGEWVKYSPSIRWQTIEIPDMPRIELNGIVYPYIKTDNERHVKVFYAENDKVDFEYDTPKPYWNRN